MPKITGKKDWLKMDRRGPAAALINQPEQLEDAWGTEEATKARQASLLGAGAIELPPKPGIGVFGWIGRGFYGICAVAALAVVGMVGARLLETNEKVNAEKDVKSLLEGKPAKIADPLLSAEAHRTLAELYLRANQGKAKAARDKFIGARAMATPVGAEVNVHTPFSPLVITPFWPRPGMSLPLTRTACACGAVIRNVIRPSADTSGDTTGGAPLPRPP